MPPQAVLYVNTERARDEGRPSTLPQPLAQLIACRIYAVSRGFDVQGAHVNWNDAPGASLPTLRSLLDQLMPSESPAADSAIQVVVVYDRSAVRISPADKIESLLGRHDVLVESVLPPHIMPPADTPQDRAYRMFLRGLFGQPTLDGAPREVRFDDAAYLPACDPVVWASLLELLADEGQVRGAVQPARQPFSDRAHWLGVLADVRQQEAAAHKEWEGLLDLLLDGVIDGTEAARRADVQRAKVEALALARRRAHGHVDALQTEQTREQLIVEIASAVCWALGGLTPTERARAARLLDLRVRTAPSADGGQFECLCLLPLIDESQREQVEVTQRRRVPKIAVPPLGGPDSPAEDAVLVWTVAAVDLACMKCWP